MAIANYYRAHKNEIDQILEKVKDYEDVIGYVLLSKDGVQETSELPPNTHSETLAIMQATIYGAAITANSELKKGMPNYIKIESKDGPVIITRAGTSILAVNMDKDSEKTLEKILSAAKEIADIIPA